MGVRHEDARKIMHLLAAILAAKEQGIGAILAFAMAVLFRGRYNGGAFTKTVIDATMCAIIAQVHLHLLTSSRTK